jgi:ABC-2 type transport system permease protein
MKPQMVGILFLKDLFLSRRMLTAYLLGAIVSVAVSMVPDKTLSFLGFILAVTVAIGMGMHMIGELILDERKSHTLAFVMSLPVSALEYTLAKISVVLVTYAIPWTVMTVGLMVLTLILPSAKDGSIPATLAVFLLLLASFVIQMATAVITESIGATIAVLVAGNVFLNLFMMKFFQAPEIAEAVKGDSIVWGGLVLQVIAVELAVIVTAIVATFYFQSRKRSFV